MMTLAQAHALLPGSMLVGDGATPIQRVHSDTRTLRTGDLFVALKGERFDGHDMLGDAAAQGAVAALAQRGLAEAGLPGLLVPDTQQALEQLAAAWRARFHLPLIAVTGSNGKTTVTQMIASVLRAWLGDGAFATEGNLNNHIGVPLTLLRLRQDDACWHRAGVVELGMNHPGEIERLARIARPTIALVNNAQREHQEFMASVEAVARENGAVIAALGPAGTAVYPADDAHAPLWHELAGMRPQLTFALLGEADVTADALWVDDHWALVLHTPAGAASLALRMAGLHNVKNALAATACALAAGTPLAAVQRGLEAFEPVKGRSQMKSATLHGTRVALVDDSYNANPDSVRAAIDVLASMQAPRLLVLGDMGEVGDRGPAFHAEVGAYARERGIEQLWCAGAMSADAARAFGGEARHFADVPALIAAREELPAAASVLVKGSRFMQMERVVRALQGAEETPGRPKSPRSPSGGRASPGDDLGGTV
jgi:UDP-N-acetylmuramoyl-tripeptide--D-alanyl-D-alanine ligase